MAMLLKKTLTSFLLVGIVPLASLSLAACSGTTSESAESSPSNSSMTQMEHGSMGNSSSMPMDHGSMTSMDLGPADENFSLQFIDAMSPHH
jgi:uncharacterized protein (DUF305 family)